MSDFPKQIEYWKTTDLSDLETAEMLIQKGKNKQGLFFCHLTIEKLLKAHYVRCQKDLAPKSHNLELLHSRTDIVLSNDLKDFLPIIMEFNIEGGYPDDTFPTVTKEEVFTLLSKTKELKEWLVKKL